MTDICAANTSPLHSPMYFLQAQPSLNVLDLRNLMINNTLETATLLKVRQLSGVLYRMEKKKQIVRGPPNKVNDKPTWTVVCSNKKKKHEETKKAV